MKTTSDRRLILCLEPNLVGTALAAWLAGTGAEVINDPSGVAALVAGRDDIVVSSHPYLSMATVVVIEEGGSEVSIYRNGSKSSHRYHGLEWLGALIEEQRGPPEQISRDPDQEVRMTEPLRSHL
jgi:hypothetical protein